MIHNDRGRPAIVLEVSGQTRNMDTLVCIFRSKCSCLDLVKMREGRSNIKHRKFSVLLGMHEKTTIRHPILHFGPMQRMKITVYYQQKQLQRWSPKHTCLCFSSFFFAFSSFVVVDWNQKSCRQL